MAVIVTYHEVDHGAIVTYHEVDHGGNSDIS
jgi:hypothetical protein